MNQEKDDISKMLMEVGATAEIVGVSKLTEILKHIQKSQKDLTIEEYDKAMLIINIVCETYSMTLEDFYSNKRKNNRTQGQLILSATKPPTLYMNFIFSQIYN